ncbi:hypothetical protein [Rivularia sp. PCC 7116]|nr:hypothetical protein [Rivularia sp. PCC 7116]
MIKYIFCQSFNTVYTNLTAIEPSPTVAVTRLIDSQRILPPANIPS